MMQEKDIIIHPFIEIYRQEVLTIWEKSVLATHQFLSPTDFVEIKELVANLNFILFF